MCILFISVLLPLFSETNMYVDVIKLDSLKKRQKKICRPSEIDLRDAEIELDNIIRKRKTYHSVLDKKTKVFDKCVNKEKAAEIQNEIDRKREKIEQFDLDIKERREQLNVTKEKQNMPFDASELVILQKEIDYETNLFEKRLRFLMTHTPLQNLHEREISNRLIVWPYSY